MNIADAVGNFLRDARFFDRLDETNPVRDGQE